MISLAVRIVSWIRIAATFYNLIGVTAPLRKHIKVCMYGLKTSNPSESKIKQVSILTLFDLDSSSWVEESNEC